MGGWLEQSPEKVAARMANAGRRRAWIARDPTSGRPVASAPELDEVADFLAEECSDYRDHEAVFLQVGPETGALFGAFLHRCSRGQTQGGLRRQPYPSFEPFLRDGLRLALGMGRKCALAGLWWGGGKGLIADTGSDDPVRRRRLYAEYAAFVTSLRGAYITAEDAGTTPDDMAVIHRHTRFATCIPTRVGGSGNPSAMTAAGVVCAIEAALAFRGEGTLAGKRVAMQGAGNVGGTMIELLLDRDVDAIVASELSEERRSELLDRHGSSRLELRPAERGDNSILAEPCDVLSPNGLGGVLDAKTIAGVRARLVCGAANNPLADDERDAQLLAERDITFVPDFVANRMGIVACSNEQYGSLPADPAIERHLDADWEHGIPQVTRRVFELAERQKTTPVAAANRLADEASSETHPLFGDRARELVRSLIEGGWDREPIVSVEDEPGAHS